MAKMVVVVYCKGQTHWPYTGHGANTPEMFNMTIDGRDPVVGDIFEANVYHNWPHQPGGPNVPHIPVRAKVVLVYPLTKLLATYPYYNWPSTTTLCDTPVIQSTGTSGFFIPEGLAQFSPVISSDDPTASPKLGLIGTGKEIRSFNMDISALPAAQTSRSFTVSGDPGAVFTLWVINEDNYNYNFVNSTFENDANEKLRNIEINAEGRYQGIIVFPAVTDDDQYTIYLQAESHSNTKLSDVLGGGSIVKLGNEEEDFTIQQFTDTTLTFSLLHSSGTVTEPSNITISTPRNTIRNDNEFTTATIDWEVTTSGVFTLLRQPLVSDFETTTTKTHVGIDTVGDTFVMNNVRNIFVGMDVSGSGIAGSPTISQINPPTDKEVAETYPLTKYQSDDDIKTIVLTTPSGNHSISQDTVLTFTGTGTDATESIYKTSFDVVSSTTGNNNFACKLTDMTPQLTAAVSSSTTVPVNSAAGLKVDTTQTVDGATTASTTVTLDSVTGCWVGQTLMSISSGTLTGTPTITAINSTTKVITLSRAQTFADGITLKFANSIVSGIGIDNSSSDPFIDGISSLNLTLNAAQTIEDDQVLTITGSSNTATISGTIRVYTIGSDDFTTTLNLDNFLIVA